MIERLEEVKRHFPPMLHDRFKVVDVLMGGMGMVYLCVDSDDGSAVALKTFRPELLSAVLLLHRVNKGTTSASKCPLLAMMEGM